MKVFLGLGKGLALLFWLALVVSCFIPFAYPFTQGMWLVGAGLILIHLIELVFFQARLLGRANPWLDHLQGLVFGIFHLLGLPQPRARRARHA